MAETRVHISGIADGELATIRQCFAFERQLGVVPALAYEMRAHSCALAWREKPRTITISRERQTRTRSAAACLGDAAERGLPTARCSA
jgi:hypothetical protein